MYPSFYSLFTVTTWCSSPFLIVISVELMQITVDEAEDSNSELFSQMFDEAERGQNSDWVSLGHQFSSFQTTLLFWQCFLGHCPGETNFFFRLLAEESRFSSSILMYCAGFIFPSLLIRSPVHGAKNTLTTCCSRSGSHCGDAVTVHVSVRLYSRPIFKSMFIALESVLYISLDISY